MTTTPVPRAHDFIKTGDADAHPSLQDSNGEVVLNQCRVCGQAEGSLTLTCPGPPMATAAQKEEIIRLLNSTQITRPEKTKMLLNINRLSEQRADKAIANLRETIEARENGQQQKPDESHLVPVEQRDFSFYDMLKCARTEVAMRRRVYPGRIERCSMTQANADRETEMMERIHKLFHHLSTGHLKLLDSLGHEVTDIGPWIHG